jgi:hypothetical protein
MTALAAMGVGLRRTNDGSSGYYIRVAGSTVSGVVAKKYGFNFWV